MADNALVNGAVRFFWLILPSVWPATSFLRVIFPGRFWWAQKVFSFLQIF